MSDRECALRFGTLLAALLFLCSSGRAQINEGRSWLGVGADRELSKDWLLSLNGQLRLSNDFKAFQQVFGEAELVYDLPDGWELFGLYRLSHRPEDLVNRLAGGASKRWNFKPFYLTLRGQYQHEESRTAQAEGVWRTKLTGRYRHNKRWSFYLNSENWSAWYPDLDPGQRLRIGAAGRFSRKDHSVKFTYYYQNQWGSDESAHILSLKYGWEWDRPKKRKSGGPDKEADERD